MGARFHAAVIRQAARPGLPGGDGLGQVAPAPAPSRRGGRGDQRALPGRLRADHWSAPGRLVRVRAGMRFHALVEVRLRPGIADPQGATIERALPALGFEGVEGVRVGKAIRFDVDAADEAAARAEIDELCRRLLANPVIEDADISISPAQGSITTGGRSGRAGASAWSSSR